MVITEAADEAEANVESRPSKVGFSEEKVSMLYAILAAAVQPRDLKALVRRNDQSGDRRAE